MAIRNSKQAYGSVAQFLHWVMAIAIIGTFALALWMRSLNYFDPWYQIGWDIHQGVGMVLFVLLIGRLIWQYTNVRPDDSDLKPFERRIAHWVHHSFYVLLFAIMVSGYLFSTADGRGIDLFGWFSVPSVYQEKRLADLSGDIHYYLSIFTIGLAGLHALAALKHHFIDKNSTLRRMLPFVPKASTDAGSVTNQNRFQRPRHRKFLRSQINSKVDRRI